MYHSSAKDARCIFPAFLFSPASSFRLSGRAFSLSVRQIDLDLILFLILTLILILILKLILILILILLADGGGRREGKSPCFSRLSADRGRRFLKKTAKVFQKTPSFFQKTAELSEEVFNNRAILFQKRSKKRDKTPRKVRSGRLLTAFSPPERKSFAPYFHIISTGFPRLSLIGYPSSGASRHLPPRGKAFPDPYFSVPRS